MKVSLFLFYLKENKNQKRIYLKSHSPLKNKENSIAFCYPFQQVMLAPIILCEQLNWIMAQKQRKSPLICCSNYKNKATLELHYNVIHLGAELNTLCSSLELTSGACPPEFLRSCSKYEFYSPLKLSPENGHREKQQFFKRSEYSILLLFF